MHYVACWTEDDGIYSCAHEHASVADAMKCLVPDGGRFLRAYDAGVFRSLTNREFIDFLEALRDALELAHRAQGGELTVPLTVNAE